MKDTTTTIGSLTREGGGAVQTGPFGSQLHRSDYTDTGVPVIMPKDIVEDRVNLDGIARVPESIARRLSRHELRIGDIVYPRRGDLNKRALVEYDARQLCGTGCIRIRLGDGPVIPKWLFYYLRQPQVVAYVESQAVGATMLNLNTSILESVEIRYPPLPTQRRIADVLSAYDDLIENNKRRMALLEESIHRLYREWFVHLRFPGHERAKVVDGVPEGWERKSMSDYFNVLSGGTPKTRKTEYWGGDIPFFTPKDAGHGAFVLTTEKSITEQGLRSCNSSLFPAWTLFVTARGTVGKLALAQRPMAMNQSCYALKPKREGAFSFTYAAATGAISAMKSAAVGGVFDTIIRKTFSSIPFVWPTKVLIDQYELLALPLLQQIKLLSAEVEQLTQARDALLPRLMNGSLMV